MPRLALGFLVLVLLATPAAASAGEPYRVIVFGDSYGSGEGAPGTAGIYTEDGRNPNPIARWAGTSANRGFTGDTEDGARRCHRSPRATAAKAVGSLTSEFPAIDFTYRSFACSGARIDDGIIGPYIGVIPQNTDVEPKPSNPDTPLPPQITQANAFLDTLPGGTRIDALVMNIGGNNLNFGRLIERCTDLRDGKNPCSPPSANPDGGGDTSVENDFRVGTGPNDQTGLDDIANLYREIDRRIDRTGGSPLLRTVPRQVILTGPPNPLGAEFSGCGSLTGQYDYENRLSSNERNWINSTVVPDMVAAMQDGAQASGWAFVPLDAQLGMCSATSARMFNRNRDALRTQGATAFSEFGIAASHGWVHPNDNGFGAMAPALADRLRSAVISRFTALTAPSGAIPLPVISLASRVRLLLTDSSDTFATRPSANLVNPASRATGAVGGASLTLPLPATRASTATAVTRRCGPVGFDGGGAPRGCGPGRNVSLLIGTPKAPTETTAVPDPLGLKVSWTKGSAVTLRRFVVEANQVETTGTPARLQMAVDGAARTVVVPADPGTRYTVSVSECTDRGCVAGPETPTVRSGKAPDFDESDLQRPFVQEQREANPTGVFSMSSGLRARPGRAARLLVAWGTWRSWRDLRSIQVRFTAQRGEIARASLDLVRERAVLRRPGGRRRRGRLGSRKVLRAGPLRLALRRAAIQASGPTSRLVTLRLPVIAGRALRGQDVYLSIGATAKGRRPQAPRLLGSFRVGGG